MGNRRIIRQMFREFASGDRVFQGGGGGGARLEEEIAGDEGVCGHDDARHSPAIPDGMHLVNEREAAIFYAAYGGGRDVPGDDNGQERDDAGRFLPRFRPVADD